MPGGGGTEARPGSVRRVVIVLAALVLVGACSSGDASPSGATVSEVSTTTAPPDPWAVPDPIDAAYVERVLAELDRIDGDAARLIVAAGELTPPAVDRMRAIYGTDELNFQLEQWGELVGDRFAGIRKPPGNRVTEVRDVRSAEADCLFSEVTRDFSAVAEKAAAPVTSFLTLTRAVEGLDPGAHNRTGWSIAAVRVPTTTEAEVAARCDG